MARIEFDLDGTVVSANDNFLSLMGYTLEEVVGKPHATFVDEQTRNSSQYATFWANLRRGEFQQGRFQRLTKDGQDVWLEATYSPIIDDSGRVQGVLVLAFFLHRSRDVAGEFEDTLNTSGVIDDG